MKHPDAVTRCNEEMEACINDPNRSIATLALTTLLKTGGENSVDRLMKQIGAFMGEIGDEFKIVVVRAIHSLCLKYPKKHPILLAFLSSTLREEGGFEFKKTIVDSILGIMERIPESKELGLYHLCEFIEDCEFASLSCRILHILGEEGTETESPAKFIRFVYNRVILEKPCVRVYLHIYIYI
jgi:coatomer subunit gamma